MSNLFTQDFRTTPYWWDHVPRPALPDTPLPARVDVAVIGSGYTGLSAALQTARGGRATLVLDAEEAGFGCSTRNGGQISTSIKPGFAALARRYGSGRATGILQEGHNSLAWVTDFVAAERIDCDFRACGRFHAAHNPAQYEALARQVQAPSAGPKVEATSSRAPSSATSSAPTRISAASSTPGTPRSIRAASIRGCWSACGKPASPSCPAVLPPRSSVTARRSASTRPRALSRPRMWWSPPTAIPAG